MPERCDQAPKQIPGLPFRIEYCGHVYEFPHNLSVKVNGISIFQDISREWRQPWNYLAFATYGSHLVVEAAYQDCVDYYWPRYLVLSRNSVVADFNPDGAFFAGYAGGLMVLDDALTAWDQGFCNQSPHFGYVLRPGSGEHSGFVRETIENAPFCAPGDLPGELRFTVLEYPTAGPSCDEVAP